MHTVPSQTGRMANVPQQKSRIIICAENIALLQFLHSPSTAIDQNVRAAVENDGHRALSLEQEQQLTGVLAVLSSIREDANLITAAAIREVRTSEEQHHQTSLEALVAVNKFELSDWDDYLVSVCDGLGRIFNALSRATRGRSPQCAVHITLFISRRRVGITCPRQFCGIQCGTLYCIPSSEIQYRTRKMVREAFRGKLRGRFDSGALERASQQILIRLRDEQGNHRPRLPEELPLRLTHLLDCTTVREACRAILAATIFFDTVAIGLFVEYSVTTRPTSTTTAATSTFDVILGLKDIGLEESKKQVEIAAVTGRYAALQDVLKHTRACAHGVVRRQC
ncbi:hypothetical protein BN1708_015245 [Verticillium longisporum]|uniref:Uncharacterized protein n=1 Tax=Verticillium longisporum TaxID=100787 RepID=A0A0G4M2S7_VERLO|nr:hypothetical protein BN1708_015245 [Verticillium longisporum]